MLLTFEGKGCINCPFGGITIGGFGARIPTCMLSYGVRLKRFSCNLDSTDTTDEGLAKLSYNSGEKPKDCPFAQEPCTLEIQAWND